MSFADMNHERMYRVHRETRNGADSMQSGKECQMDEKDAISILNMIEAHGALPVKAKEMAINVLEEVQQYRAIGTPKKIKDLLEYLLLFFIIYSDILRHIILYNLIEVI